MDTPFWVLLGQWGPSGVTITLLALAVWMIFTGRLVTRREHQELREDRDYWRNAYETSEGTRRIMAGQTERILGPTAEVITQVVTALKDEVGR